MFKDNRMFTRRQLLLGSLGVGVVATAINESARLRSLAAREAKLTELALQSQDYIESNVDNAIEGDLEATQRIEEIQESINFIPPNVPYDREMSKILIQCSRLGTEQYLTGKFDPNYDGAIASLPTYSDRLNPFTQIASIVGPDDAKVKTQVKISEDTLLPFLNSLETSFEQVQTVIQDLAGETITLSWKTPVYWGFVLQSDRANILVFRGTQRTNEWIQTVRAKQIDNRKAPQFKFKGKAHQGFVGIYGSLASSTIEIIKTLDPNVPLYVAGHSLGSPLATLAAMDIALRVPEIKEQIRLYSFAGPRLGDPEFARAHNELIPNSYRVANLTDPTTIVPPTAIGDTIYIHVGEPWEFVTSKNDVGPHHYISTYREAIEKEVETNQQRNYPISGIN